MANNIKIIDKMVEFAVKNTDAMDRALGKMSVDIERMAKQQVPVSATKAMKRSAGARATRGGGHLQSSGRTTRMGLLSFAVIFNKEYAAFQEWGGDGKRVVKNYSTPGTKKFYLRDPGELITSRGLEYIKNEASNIKVI